MEYTREQFIEDVKAEAVALREHASKDEIDRLNLQTFHPGFYDDCVYGQMTGDCRNKRAIELISACCRRSVTNGSATGMFQSFEDNIDSFELKDGASAIIEREVGKDIAYFSSLETYIQYANAKNENLIAYLRGETDTLDL